MLKTLIVILAILRDAGLTDYGRLFPSSDDADSAAQRLREVAKVWAAVMAERDVPEWALRHAAVRLASRSDSREFPTAAEFADVALQEANRLAPPLAVSTGPDPLDPVIVVRPDPELWARLDELGRESWRERKRAELLESFTPPSLPPRTSGTPGPIAGHVRRLRRELPPPQAVRDAETQAAIDAAKRMLEKAS